MIFFDGRTSLSQSYSDMESYQASNSLQIIFFFLLFLGHIKSWKHCSVNKTEEIQISKKNKTNKKNKIKIKNKNSNFFG